MEKMVFLYLGEPLAIQLGYLCLLGGESESDGEDMEALVSERDDPEHEREDLNPGLEIVPGVGAEKSKLEDVKRSSDVNKDIVGEDVLRDASPLRAVLP